MTASGDERSCPALIQLRRHNDDLHVSFVPANHASKMKLRGESLVVGGESMRQRPIAPAFTQAWPFRLFYIVLSMYLMEK